MSKKSPPLIKPHGKNVIKAAPIKLEDAEPRKIKLATHKSFKLSKSIKIKGVVLKSGYANAKDAYSLIKSNWRVLLGIMAVYAVLDLLLVRGFGGASILSVKHTYINQGESNNAVLAANLLNYLAGNLSMANSANSGIYQTILLVIFSLVVIWTLRQIIAEKTVGVRKAFYNGTYPLIPFLLVSIVISLQLIPFIAGSWLYTTVVNGAIAINSPERLTALLLTSLLGLLSFYMMTSSVFALYIVTLPNVTPMQALRSARQLVLHRRWTVLRKLIFLPFFIFLTGSLIMVPFLIYVTPLADLVFFGLIVATPLFVHAYMYLLYRQLI